MLPRVWSDWTAHSTAGGYKMQQFVKQLAISYEVWHSLTIWPSKSTHRYWPKKKKIRVHTKTGRWMFIAASLLIAKNWEQPKCVKQWMYEQRVVQAHWNIHQLGWCSGESCGKHSTPWIHVQGFSEMGKTAEAKQGGGGLLQRDIREFLGVMEVLCQSVLWGWHDCIQLSEFLEWHC